jgi:hypothetical protein
MVMQFPGSRFGLNCVNIAPKMARQKRNLPAKASFHRNSDSCFG